MKKSLDYAIISLERVKALSVMERSMTKCQNRNEM
ncbi:transposase [ [[Clostridium] symbiosum WAL-14163]|uniref:Transposase n=1 Tax=Clostridium symbiosum (strain WAL-14163) TaxID=742740 RepID=E7GUA5_CLOS6|nr:transposase [ [[Clostridium] symbiosum WAL-14163]